MDKVKEIVFTTPYSAQKKEELFWLIEKVVPLNPTTIVEIGVLHGGTCAIFKQVFPSARVIGIDITTEHPEARKEFMEKYGFELIIGDSTSPETKQKLIDMIENIDLLFIDGDHTYKGVSKDFNMYAPLVKKGIIALQDIADAPQNGGVPIFWEELKNQYTNTEEYVFPEQNGEVTWAGMGTIEI